MIHVGGRVRVGGTVLLGCIIAGLWAVAPTAQTQNEWLCDSSYQDCRTPIIKAINAEPVTGGIDVSLWFMDDWRYVDALIAAHNRGVPIRMIVDPAADVTYPDTKPQRDRMVAAGIPMRRYAGSAINHWKAFIFAAQGKMNFSAANFANGSYSPIVPYTQYVDEAVYFTDKPSILASFESKFDDRWTNTTRFVDFANITEPPTRKYGAVGWTPIDPDLNFVPDQNYENRLKTQVDLEGSNVKFPDLVPKIDVVMFRITSAKIPDALIARARAGVPIRLINEEQQYRSTHYFWDSYNMDRMYMACVDAPAPCQPMQLKFKDNVTDQDLHQKSIILTTVRSPPRRNRWWSSAHPTGPAPLRAARKSTTISVLSRGWFSGLSTNSSGSGTTSRPTARRLAKTSSLISSRCPLRLRSTRHRRTTRWE